MSWLGLTFVQLLSDERHEEGATSIYIPVENSPLLIITKKDNFCPLI